MYDSRRMSTSAASANTESSISRGTKRAMSPNDWPQPKKIRSLDQSNQAVVSSGGSNPSEEKDSREQLKVSLPPIFATFDDSYRASRPASRPELDLESRIRRAASRFFPSFPSTNEKSGRPTLSHSNFDDADYGHSALLPRSNFDNAHYSRRARLSPYSGSDHPTASGLPSSTQGQLSMASPAVRYESDGFAMPILSDSTLDTAANRRSLSAPGMKSEWAFPASDIQQYPVTLTSRNRDKLPKETADFLDAWLHRHSDDPYASEEETKRLSYATGLSVSQVSAYLHTNRTQHTLPALDNRAEHPKETADFLDGWLQSHSDHPYASEEETKRLSYATGLSMSQASAYLHTNSTLGGVVDVVRPDPSSPPPSISFVSTVEMGKKDEPDSSEEETARESEEAPRFAVPEGINVTPPWMGGSTWTLSRFADLERRSVQLMQATGPPGAASDAYDAVTGAFEGRSSPYNPWLRRLLSSLPPVGVRKKDEADSSGEEPFMASASRYTLPPPEDFRLPSLEDFNFQYRSRPSPQDDNYQDNIADSSGEETAGESEDAPRFAVAEEVVGPPGAASDAYDAVTADSALHRQDERDVMSDQLYDIFAVIERLDKFFHLEKASYAKFLACRGASAQQLLDFLQDLLDYDVDVTAINRRRLFKALLRLSGDSKLYPRCLTLTGLQQERLVAGGSFGDVYKGLLGDQSVAIKMMRVFKESDIDALLKEFGREALIWRQLSHPNLLPFFGLYYFQQRLCLVSPWMENGHMREFLKKKLYDTDYLLSLILDVALGLEHLHDTGVVHSDLKGDNIFVTPSGRACIADFGLSSIITSVSSIQFTHSSKPTQGGTTRYQAPELLRGGHNDTLSDIYAFAGVAYEILTGTPPFPDLRTDGAVVTAVLDGCRPSQPSSCSGTPSLDGLWKLLQDCWEAKPARRPTAAQIVQRLMSPDIQATKMQSAPDWDELFTSRFRGYLASPRPLPSFSKFERIIFGDASNIDC